MPSPFPGMDPFLEAHWGDVHTTLATYIRNELQVQLPGGLKARIVESFFLESHDDDLPDPDRDMLIYPNVGIYERDNSTFASAQGGGAVAVAEPIITSARRAPQTKRAVHVYDPSRKMRLITAIELISPGNKIGTRNPQAYQTRAEMILDADASLVEIDLIRQGRHVLQCPAMPGKGHYTICVTRAWKQIQNEVYPARFDVHLPNIGIPLRKQDFDATLQLQNLIDRAYADGRYEDTDYAQPLTPSFTAAEKRWLKARLKKRK